MRNPWGKSEWKGAWSDKSAEKKTYAADVQAYIDSLPPDEQFKMDADDGTFLMHYDDWKDQFTSLFLNVDFPEDWTGVRFRSAWTKSACGGLPAKHEKALLERFAKNPQFFIHCSADTEVMFSMTQTGGRLPLDGQYSQYPFADQLKYAAVSVFRLDPNAQKRQDTTYLPFFDKENLVYQSPIKRERENSGRANLKAGVSYVVVCSTEMPKQRGRFFLSVYFNQALRDVSIKRVVHPSDTNGAKEEVLPYFIPEEAEKLVNQTPVWKIELVKESLKYMMTDEDQGTNW